MLRCWWRDSGSESAQLVVPTMSSFDRCSEFGCTANLANSLTRFFFCCAALDLLNGLTVPVCFFLALGDPRRYSIVSRSGTF